LNKKNKQIISSKVSILPNYKEIWEYRDLFFLLAYKDFKVRYAQTFLGFAWGIIQPCLTLLIFIAIFQKALKIETENVPYPVFAIIGMTLWTYFSFVVNQSGRSIISEQGLVTKIYFPRIVIPISKSLVGFIDFGITFTIMIIILYFFDVSISPNVIWAPLFVFLTILLSMGIGVWISALTIRYRDFQHVIPFIVQIGIYASPVAYPITYFSAENLSFYYLLNPIAGLIDGFRWSLVGTPFVLNDIYYSVFVILVIYGSSHIYFNRVESKIADII
jgi:lipopolysaccharide transport system permease protein